MSMFLEKVPSHNLGHLSYIIGHGGEAAVIDPRRDCGVYVNLAHAQGATITTIFETHKNEDYVSGAIELARRTGADILHGKDLDFGFGEPVEDGDMFQVGGLMLTVLQTPGHTLESISIAVADSGAGQDTVAVFTGDCLFIGDTGRTDFYPGRDEEVAGMLYDSIFQKLLPLGDHVIVLPAHGSGSVCGSMLSEREFSTLGYERRNNPVLQNTDRDAFIRFKTSERHYRPPYFARMEEFNKLGNAPLINEIPKPRPLPIQEFTSMMDKGMTVLDVRDPEAFSGAFIPGALAIPVDMIPAYAGWFLDFETDIGLVVHDYEAVDTAVRYLLRLGYDRVVGFLDKGMSAWETSGRAYGQIPALHVVELVDRIKGDSGFTLLDVRKHAEWDAARLPGATHVFLGDLPQRLDEIPRDKPVTTFCGSGKRAIIAASILKRAGFERVEDALGSMAACQAFGCPLDRGRK